MATITEIENKLAGLKNPAYEAAKKKIITKNNRFAFVFDFSYTINEAIKNRFSGNWDFNKHVGGHWSIPAHINLVNALLDYADNYWHMPDATIQLIQTLISDFKKQSAVNAQCVAASSATTAAIAVSGLNIPLMDFQRAGVQYCTDKKRVMLADDMGLGKTAQALATVQHLNAYPSIVVCPATLKWNWRNEVDKWLNGKTALIIKSGKMKKKDAELFQTADIIIINYENVKKHEAILKEKKFKSILIDESHYCKNQKAIRTKAVKEIAKGIDVRICISGTPILNRPVELFSQLDILGYTNIFGTYFDFTKKYCNGHKETVARGKTVWNVKGSSNISELSQKLRAHCYVRRTKAQVLPQLPEKTRTIQMVEMDEIKRAEYDKAKYNFVQYIQDAVDSDKKFLATIADKTADEKKELIRDRKHSQEEKARRDQMLMQINKLRMISAEGKVATVAEWIENFLESDSNEKLVLFAHHKNVVAALKEKFNCLTITGDDTAEEKAHTNEQFQTNPNCRLIVCSLKAASQGLNLFAGRNVAFIELDWTPTIHDQAEARCHRMGQDRGVNVYYFCAENSIDNFIYDIVDKKRQIIDTVLDGSYDASQYEAQVVKQITEVLLQATA